VVRAGPLDLGLYPLARHAIGLRNVEDEAQRFEHFLRGDVRELALLNNELQQPPRNAAPYTPKAHFVRHLAQRARALADPPVDLAQRTLLLLVERSHFVQDVCPVLAQYLAAVCQNVGVALQGCELQLPRRLVVAREKCIYDFLGERRERKRVRDEVYLINVLLVAAHDKRVCAERVHRQNRRQALVGVVALAKHVVGHHKSLHVGSAILAFLVTARVVQINVHAPSVPGLLASFSFLFLPEKNAQIFCAHPPGMLLAVLDLYAAVEADDVARALVALDSMDRHAPAMTRVMCIAHSVQMVGMLAEHGVPVNHANTTLSPLLAAIRRRDTAVARDLLERGAVTEYRATKIGTSISMLLACPDDLVQSILAGRRHPPWVDAMPSDWKRILAFGVQSTVDVWPAMPFADSLAIARTWAGTTERVHLVECYCERVLEDGVALASRHACSFFFCLPGGRVFASGSAIADYIRKVFTSTPAGVAAELESAVWEAMDQRGTAELEGCYAAQEVHLQLITAVLLDDLEAVHVCSAERGAVADALEAARLTGRRQAIVDALRGCTPALPEGPPSARMRAALQIGDTCSALACAAQCADALQIGVAYCSVRVLAALVHVRVRWEDFPRDLAEMVEQHPRAAERALHMAGAEDCVIFPANHAVMLLRAAMRA